MRILKQGKVSSVLSAELPFAVRYTNVSYADKASIREFLANGYFSTATLAVEITKFRFGVKSTTARLITLANLMNGQPV
jgi:hypothetical protein